MIARTMGVLCAAAAVCLGQSGFSPGALDPTANPCTDFYQYACGTWLKNNPIPPDQSTWGRFSELHERNQRILRDILETSAAKQNRSPDEQKIGDYFASCMDEKKLDADGIEPLRPVLRRIERVRTRGGLTELLSYLHSQGLFVFFKLESGQDFKDATEVIAQIDQGGLGLPERDYYFKEDERSVELRRKYVLHLERTFTLMGTKDAAEKAAAVMRIETALAKAHMDVTSRRDPSKLYHRMPVAELSKLTPSIRWRRFLRDVGAPVPTLNVAVPEYMKTIEQQIRTAELADLKAYFSWFTVHSQAALLSTAFANENFDFYGRALKGMKEIRPRWKRCVWFTDMDLGFALGRKYVELTIGSEGKERTLEMVRALERALERDLREVDWMTPATKKSAVEKLKAITNKIGYPDKWRDYSKLTIRRGDMIGNSLRANRFLVWRELAKIGKPVDKNAWMITPPAVNAYYDPQNNNITFAAGILQPPFFDKAMDDAVNFGGIGAVIGHELTHGFDDQGSKFDPAGNLANWWSEKDDREFKARTECFARQYGGYEALKGVKLNGKLTLGENVSDNGGLRIAHMALLDALAGKARDKIDGFTPEQRFFLAWGQIWCTNLTEEALRLYSQTDPHVPGEFRVNGPVSNMPEFWKAFGCKPGQPMVRGDRACRVW